jgi:hypothetical protein
MSKVETLARPARDLLVAAMLIAFVMLTAGCGGSSGAPMPPAGNTPPPVTPPPPAAIEGVATPTSVSVVTATNAQ